MRIMSPGDTLMVEADIAPRDAGALAIGQKARIELPMTSASLPARVEDIKNSPRQGGSQVIARLAFEESESPRPPTALSVPGVAVNVVIETERRSTLSYILRPFSDALTRPMPR